MKYNIFETKITETRENGSIIHYYNYTLDKV